jgi:hypothetical protein
LSLATADGDREGQSARRALNRPALKFFGDPQLALALGAVQDDFWHGSLAFALEIFCR